MTPRKRRTKAPGRALVALEAWPQLDPAKAARDALRSAEALETLEQAYQAWDALRLEQRRFTQAAAEAHRRLEDDAAFAIGAAKAARALGARPATGLTTAKGKLRAAGAGLEAVVAHGAQLLARTQGTLAELIAARVDRRLAHAPPKVQLTVRVLAGERRIVHLARPSSDDAVALTRVLAGAVPSRHGFLFDDAVETLGQAPPTLYAEELGPGRPPSLRTLLEAGGPQIPVRGMIAFLLPRPKKKPAVARLLQRGPVLELELEDDGAFRGVLTRDEAEAAAGYFLKLQLDGRLAVTLATGPA